MTLSTWYSEGLYAVRLAKNTDGGVDQLVNIGESYAECLKWAKRYHHTSHYTEIEVVTLAVVTSERIEKDEVFV